MAFATTYAEVNFRSRLEAKWADMFDLMGLKWEYEPAIDLPGWIPDFRISTPIVDVLTEVKPCREVSLGECADYNKARKFWPNFQILLLGLGPTDHGIGFLMDCPDGHVAWDDVFHAIGGFGPWMPTWREAGNVVMWRPT